MEMKKVNIPEYWEFYEDLVEKIFLNSEETWCEIQNWHSSSQISRFIYETGDFVHKQVKWLNIKLDYIDSLKCEGCDPVRIEKFKDSLKFYYKSWGDWKEEQLEMQLYDFRNAPNEIVNALNSINTMINEGEKLEIEMHQYLDELIKQIKYQNQEDDKYERMKINIDEYFPPLEDNEADVPEGFIYILSNPLINGIYKVSFTIRNPDFRAKQISMMSTLPLPFEVEKYWRVSFPKIIIREIHKKLEYSVFSKDFFKEDKDHIEAKISSIISNNNSGNVNDQFEL
tara:strand:- start:36 stop:887 length:852 start_codon:yes stop_codon:yes gene_type:complete